VKQDLGVNDREQSSASAAAAAATEKAAQAVVVAQSAERDGGSWEFKYSWPAAVSAIPELARQLATERDATLAEERSEWDKQVAEFKGQDCGGCKSRSFGKEWKVVANLPGWLSTSAQTDTYTGGAHGIYSLQSLVWDKRAKAAHDGIDLFRTPGALDAALGDKLCDALNTERAKRRGAPVAKATGSDDYGFNQCQQVKDSTVLVGSSNGKTFDRIGIWFGPYVAGPYAEGAYELDFPMTRAMLDAVKPAYKAAFSVKS
jgi:hypothetical protein